MFWPSTKITMEKTLKLKKRVKRAKTQLKKLELEQGKNFKLTKLYDCLYVKSTDGDVTAVFRKQVRGKRPYITLGKLTKNYCVEKALSDCWEYENSMLTHGFVDQEFTELQQRINSIETLNDLACEFFLHHDEINFPTGKEPLKELPALQEKYQQYAQSYIGETLVTCIDRKHIIRVMNKVYEKSPQSQCPLCSMYSVCEHCEDLDDYAALANSLLYVLTRVLELGVQYRIIKKNVAATIKAKDIGYKPHSNRRALVMLELATLVKRLEKSMESEPANVCAVYLLLLFGARKMELVKAKISEFRKEIIPLKGGLKLEEDMCWVQQTTKTGAIRAKFITPLMKKYLDRLVELNNGSEYLLPSRTSASKSPYISASTLNKFITRIASDLKFVVHELRHTTRTLLSNLEIPDDVGDSYITHSKKKYLHDALHLYPKRKDAAIDLSNLIETLIKRANESTES